MSRSTPEGMDPLTKDRFDAASKSVAIIGGLTSAVILILAMRGGTEQRARELRWNQAKLAMELVDEMLSDPQAFNALRMTDWTVYDYQIKGKDYEISSELVRFALDVKNNKNLPGVEGIFIRESFDRLFYHMGKIERSLESSLIRFEDVRSPMDYYVPFMRSTYGEILLSYMKQLNHNDALTFMNRFQAPAESQSR